MPTPRARSLRDRTGAADNVLTSRLGAMVDAGLVLREPYREGARPRFDYRLTEAGADALPVLHAYALWAEKHAPAATGRRFRLVCRHCGQDSSRGEVCSDCGTPLTTQSAAWIRPHATDETPRPLVGPVAG